MVKNVWLASLLMVVSIVAQADEPSPVISHLLQFVAESGCDFERNGSNHSSVEARDHMRLKYNNAGSRIKSPEDFIKYAATGSSLTGRTYYVSCKQQQRLSSRDWLLAELDRYRNGR